MLIVLANFPSLPLSPSFLRCKFALITEETATKEELKYSVTTYGEQYVPTLGIRMMHKLYAGVSDFRLLVLKLLEVLRSDRDTVGYGWTTLLV